MSKYDKKYRFNYLRLISIGIIFIVILLTIGYSAFSSNLAINNVTAFIKAKKIVQVTGITATDYIDGGVSNYENYTYNSVSASLSLPNATSTVTYDITITNLGSTELGIVNITGLPNNLTYSGYRLGTMLCDDTDSTVCNLGSVSTIHLTIGYADNGYDSSNTSYDFELTFTFDEVTYVASIGNDNYGTLQSAIDAVGTNNNAYTTIVLLRNTAEHLTIDAGKKIEFDFQNLVVSNDEANPIIDNYGAIRISNGTLMSNTTQGAINVKSGASLDISGGRIITTGNKQSIYNETGGYVHISGSIHFSSKAAIEGSNRRATVQNLTGATMLITGGIIESTGGGGIAISNAGNLTIGTEGGNVNVQSPTVHGLTYGVYSTVGLNFYDGVIRGKTRAFEDETKVSNIEDGYGILHKHVTISNVIYDSAYLAITYTVRFNPTTGSFANPNDEYETVERGYTLESMPTPIMTSYSFDGWYTEETGGTLVTLNTPITGDTELFAHWTYEAVAYVAQIVGGSQYLTLAEAISAAPNNVETTIELLRNTSASITVAANKKIVLDLGDYVLSNSADKPILENNGSIKLISGLITTDATQGAINLRNNVNSVFEMTGGSIVATGNRQAIYAEKGTVKISGSAYLTSKAEVASGKNRGTIQCSAGVNLIITGGTIISTYSTGIAVSNSGTMTIGEKDGVISTTVPYIQGTSYGIYSTTSFKLYDGIMKGTVKAIYGSTNDLETNSQINDTGYETIGNLNYNTAYLE